MRTRAGWATIGLLSVQLAACGARSDLPVGEAPPRTTLATPTTCDSVPGPPGARGVLELAAGPAHTCARLDDGTVWCWGDNSRGQLGDGTHVDRGVPTLVAGLSDVVQVAAGGVRSCEDVGDTSVCGGGHTCALEGDGSVLCWGDTDFDGPWKEVASPTPIEGLGSVRRIVVGTSEACGILDDGSVRCWWSSAETEHAAQDVPELAGSLAVASNALGRCGLDSTGAVQCFIDPWTPGTPSKMDGMASLGAGGLFVCAWQRDGEGACFGTDGAKVVGRDEIPDHELIDWQAQPALDCGADWIVGSEHACRRTTEGRLWCWGATAHDKLGVDAEPSPNGWTTIQPLPLEVPGLVGVMGGAAGYDHTCALTAGAVLCWGSNSDGQLGDGTAGGDRAEPAPVVW